MGAPTYQKRSTSRKLRTGSLKLTAGISRQKDPTYHQHATATCYAAPQYRLAMNLSLASTLLSMGVKKELLVRQQLPIISFMAFLGRYGCRAWRRMWGFFDETLGCSISD